MANLGHLIKVHVPNLFKEILNGGNSNWIHKIPLQQTANLLGQVAQRAAELNDPELNRLMIRLTLYEIADPTSKDYDPKLIDKLLKS